MRGERRREGEAPAEGNTGLGGGVPAEGAAPERSPGEAGEGRGFCKKALTRGPWLPPVGKLRGGIKKEVADGMFGANWKGSVKDVQDRSLDNL